MSTEPKKETSIFSSMKANKRLNVNMAKAKKAIAVREFDGPDGDYYARLSRLGDYTKDNVLNAVFEFSITTEGEYAGQKAVIFFKFADNPAMGKKVEDIQTDLFVMIQLLGISTDQPEAAIDKELKKLIDDNTEIHLRVKTNAKGYKNWTVIGVASAAGEVEQEAYVTEDEVPPEVVEEPVATEEEWEEVPVDTPEEEPEAVPEDEPEPEAAEWKPSDWVGYEMLYKKVPYTVIEAEDDTGKVKIRSAKGKEYRVAFDQMEAPTA